MNDTDGNEKEPTRVHFIDGTAEVYNVVVRRYDSNWLYALRPDTAANHCVLNSENVIRIESQTVIQVDEGIGYCDFDWRDNVETWVEQENWIATPNDDD